MKRIFLVCLFLMLNITLTVHAENTPDLEMENFKFGIMDMKPGALFVTQETNRFQRQNGILFGFTYDFVKHKKSPVNERVIIIFPDQKINESQAKIKKKSGTQHFGGLLHKGDLIGKYVIRIEHDGVLVKTVEYTIE